VTRRARLFSATETLIDGLVDESSLHRISHVQRIAGRGAPTAGIDLQAQRSRRG
jgi:hypothetical protein